MRRLFLIITLLGAMSAGAAAAAAGEDVVGYLPQDQAKALVSQMPDPPEPGSAADRADRERYRQSANGIGNAAWQRAIAQLSTNSGSFRQQLSCAVGVTIGADTPPVVTTMLARAAADAQPVAARAKDYFQRRRPFTTDGGRACDPESARNNGIRMGYSYPSGHATTGMLWSLILADMVPGRRAEALAFGKATGDLRVACRVHWQSDVAAGAQLAGSLYKLIAATPAYKADLRKAKAALVGTVPPSNC